MRARRWFAGGGAALGILAIGAAIWGFGSSGGAPTTSDAPSVATAEVTRRTLVEQTELDGTLGYGDEVPLRGTVSGIVTWLPEIGAVVSPGQTLYRVDDQPVFLMAGMMPMYRELGPGSDGEDVEQLENGLAALGYDGFTVDGEYTARTAAAVREWQEDHGLEVTGVVDLGRVVFLPAAIRVAEVQVRTGDQLTPGTTAYDYTATSRVVIGEIAASRQELVPEGTAVEVELPDGTRVAGTVSRVASVAEASGDEQGQSDPSAATLRVTVTYRGSGRARRTGWRTRGGVG